MQTTSTNRVIVESEGSGVVAHVGLHAMGAFADRLGLSHLLSSRIVARGERRPVHDRGKVLTHMALVIAGGGESCADVEHLRLQSDLFGHVASDSTVHRMFHELSSDTLGELALATAQVRSAVWDRLGLTNSSDPVLLDIDATLLDVHSENKEGAAPNYKHGYGFHPMLCFADATGECLAGTLRPGNATANTVADHVRVLDDALAQLPPAISAGHCVGDETNNVRRVVVRADSAGCTEGFLSACRARQVGFFVSARANAQVSNAVFDAVRVPEVWFDAVTSDGEVREGAAVAELTSLIEHHHLPEGTRLIVRREPLHPGAQRSLIPDVDYRYWGFWTDQDGDPRELDLTMRQHAHVENHIARLKDSGLTAMPFTNFEANAAWLFTVRLAGDLVRWFQLLCCSGSWRTARTKTMRWGFLHAPARIVRRGRQIIVRVINGWPATSAITAAYERLNLIT